MNYLDRQTGHYVYVKEAILKKGFLFERWLSEDAERRSKPDAWRTTMIILKEVLDEGTQI